MRLKIHHGTARDDEPSLCLSCRHATIIRGRNLHDEIVDCGMLYGDRSRIRFPVTSCSNYSDRRQPTLRQMEEIAWVLRTDRARKPIGFVPARDLRPKERRALSDDEWSDG
jgi:hypothetical protein